MILVKFYNHNGNTVDYEFCEGEDAAQDFVKSIITDDGIDPNQIEIFGCKKLDFNILISIS